MSVTLHQKIEIRSGEGDFLVLFDLLEQLTYIPRAYPYNSNP